MTDVLSCGYFVFIDWCPPTTRAFLDVANLGGSGARAKRVQKLSAEFARESDNEFELIALANRDDGIFMFVISSKQPTEVADVFDFSRKAALLIKDRVFGQKLERASLSHAALNAHYPVLCDIDSVSSIEPSLPVKSDIERLKQDKYQIDQLIFEVITKNSVILSLRALNRRLQPSFSSAIDSLIIQFSSRYERTLNEVELLKSVNKTLEKGHLFEGAFVAIGIIFFLYYAQVVISSQPESFFDGKSFIKAIITGVVVSLYFFMLRRILPLTSAILTVIGNSIRFLSMSKGLPNSIVKLIDIEIGSGSRSLTTGFASSYFDSMIKSLEEARELQRQQLNRAVLSTGVLVAMVVVLATIGLR